MDPKSSWIYDSPTISKFTPINSLFHSYNLYHTPILYYSSLIIPNSALFHSNNSLIHCMRLDSRLGLLPLLDRLNPLLQKRLRVFFSLQGPQHRVTQQLLCSFFILITFLQLHYDTFKCCWIVLSKYVQWETVAATLVIVHAFDDV